MPDFVFWLVAFLVGCGVGIALGRSGGRTGGLEEGKRAGLTEGERSAGQEVRIAEREAAMREAIGRVSAYLNHAVRPPLSEAPADAPPEELRERMSRALGALQDLDFFIEEIDDRREGTDIAELVQSVAQDFAAAHDVGVRTQVASTPVRASLSGPAFTDALYLVLHNAARFGAGGAVDVSVAEEDARAVVTVRDRGPGFTEEAFAKAFDPFYSTSPDGLGLGLPHVRKVVDSLGGRIELRNVPDGGAEVEISFPTS